MADRSCLTRSGTRSAVSVSIRAAVEDAVASALHGNVDKLVETVVLETFPERICVLLHVARVSHAEAYPVVAGNMRENVLREFCKVCPDVGPVAGAVLAGKLDFGAAVSYELFDLLDDSFGSVAFEMSFHEVRAAERACVETAFLDIHDTCERRFAKDPALHRSSEYRDLVAEQPDIADRIIYCGPVDDFYDYKLGKLEYRSLRFESEILDEENHQGVAVVNYNEREVPWTRIIEHKHFEFGTQPKTVITREYPADWKPGDEPYYPINDERNTKLYNEYRELAEQEGNVVFAGRLGGYKYYDMDKAIAAAFDLVESELGVIL